MEANGSCRMKNTEVKNRDFPGGPVVKNSLSRAGDEGSIPGQGAKIPYVQSNQACSPQKKTACAVKMEN